MTTPIKLSERLDAHLNNNECDECCSMLAEVRALEQRAATLEERVERYEKALAAAHAEPTDDELARICTLMGARWQFWTELARGLIWHRKAAYESLTGKRVDEETKP